MLDYYEYVATWGIYMAGVVGLLAVWWRLTRFIPWYVPRQILRVLPTVLVLVPAPVQVGGIDYAPALFVVLLDSVLVKGADALVALPYVVYALVLGALAVLGDGLFHYWRQRKTAAQ